ncbi:MAG TPA: transglutaminase family protein [Ramlibacter sp.]
MSHSISRRSLVRLAGASFVAGSLPVARAEESAHHFDPQPSGWRKFEVTTTVQLKGERGAATVWVPVPSVDTSWQRTDDSSWTGNATDAKLGADGRTGAQVLVAHFAPGTSDPTIVMTNRVQTQNRAVDWKARTAQAADPSDLHHWLQPSELITTDGIVRKVAHQIVLGADSDREKVQRIYDWVLVSTYREPKVKGCGTGDIKAMLESGNLSGKCADINALFVGLCRAAGVPARDIYGVRLVPSAFGYRTLGGNSANLTGAQHCRAEVYLKAHGWVAMDPADVTKVMREETPVWIKNAGDPLIAPVRRALFGSWEGNWMGYNSASDVKLPGSHQSKLGFFMYPQAETADGPRDPYAPNSFVYSISAREIRS